MLKSFLLVLLLFGLRLSGPSAPPRLYLDVAQFRNLNHVEGGAEVEIMATVTTQTLLYRQRAPRQFQSAAAVTLQILKANGQPAFQENVLLKPPTLTDTTIQIKNPVSFLKRVTLAEGHYTLRGLVRDQYRPGSAGQTTIELPLEVKAPPQTAFLSDIVLLARPAVPGNNLDGPFTRNGYQLTRAPGGLFGRGADNVYFYTELHQAPVGQSVRLHYHLAAPDGTAADADAPLVPRAGRPTAIVGQLPLGPLPKGEFTLTIEVRSATKKLLTTQSVHGQRELADYAPAGAPAPR